MSKLSVAARGIQTRAKAEKVAKCDAEIDAIYATSNKNQEEYDKQLLTLSSGALGLLITLTRSTIPASANRAYLYRSLAAFTACIVTVILSFQISNFGLWMAQRYWEKLRYAEDQPAFPYWVATLIKVWNFISGVFFAVGIALAVAFMLSYLKPEPTVSNQNSNLQEGAQIRVPAPGDLAQKGANIKAPPKPPPAKDQGTNRK